MAKEIRVGDTVRLKKAGCCASKSGAGEGEVTLVDNGVFAVRQLVMVEDTNNLEEQIWWHCDECFTEGVE